MDIERPSFMDVGANHPFFLSNTALFYRNGSHGINIEPNPILFRRIAQVRTEDTNIMAGIGTSHMGLRPEVSPHYRNLRNT